jgi:protein-tyrosine phosphatase
MAAVLARKLLAEAGITCDVQSAGVAASPDCSASTHAVTVMGEEGCDLLSHRSQQITDALLTQTTLILTMTAGHCSAVLSVCPAAKEKTFTLCDYAESGCDVSDPFGGDYAEYHACATQIKDLLTKCINKFKNETGFLHGQS